MHRLALICLVGFLAASTSGMFELVFAEPCSPTESASAPSDDSCPPTCALCHCGRAFQLALNIEIGASQVFEPAWTPASAFAPEPLSQDILHVPKPRLT